MEGLWRAERDSGIAAIILTGGERSFSAGGDIREFDGPDVRAFPMVRDLVEIMDAIGKPMVAAVGGLALGGGLELALACHYRVAHSNAKLGLPEVKLGILAAGGGVQRLPRLVPLPQALDMLLLGDSVSGQAALGLGLVDVVSDGRGLRAALELAERMVAEGKPIRRVRDLPPRHNREDLAGLFAERRAKLEGDAPGFVAPLRILDCVEISLTSFEEGGRAAMIALDELGRLDQSKALRYLFAAERPRASAIRPDSESLAQDIAEGMLKRAKDELGKLASRGTDRGICREALRRFGWLQAQHLLLDDPPPVPTQPSGTQIGDGAIIARIILALANEGARRLPSEPDISASAIDVLFVRRYGFPRYRGGPMFQAQLRGPENVVKAIQSFAREDEDGLWRPAPLLLELAHSGQTLLRRST